MHNSVFDCSMSEFFFKISLINAVHTDTMILAHLLDENRLVGLKSLAKEEFGEDSTREAEEMKASVIANGGIVTKDCYEMFKCDPMIMAKYGAMDALLTYRLFYVLVPRLYEQNLDKFFYEDESMPLLRGPTYELNTVGLKVDQNELATLKATLTAECEEHKAFITREIAPLVGKKYPGTTKKNVFSIDSPQQMAWLLFDEMGLEFGTLTKGGKEVCKYLGMKLPYTFKAKREFIQACRDRKGEIYQPEIKGLKKTIRAKKIKDFWTYIATDKTTLARFKDQYKWIAALLEHHRKAKLLGTYVEGIETKLQYGIIQPSFLQHGTTSGRYSSRSPNFQNLPRGDKRIKQVIVSRPGKVFVGADYSQLEPRVFAFFSGDKRLLEAFKGADDFYSVIGMEVYDKFDCIPRKEGSPDAFGIKYPKLRDLSKVIALASTYGATAFQLAPTTGKTIEATQEDIDSYFEKFPGVATMMLDSHKLVKSQGFVSNHFGRLRRMSEAMTIDKIYGRNTKHAELPYNARKMLNLAVNHRIQSTGASIMNRAAIRFYENARIAGVKCQIVLQVHDSLVIECAEADGETVALLLEDAMINTTKLEGIELEAIPKIGRNLGEV